MRILHLVTLSLLLGFWPLQAGWFKSKEEKARDQIITYFQASKQQLVEQYHLLATAKELQVQQFSFVDAQGQATTRLEDATGFAVVFTIFWEGPVTKDGYLKIATVYDGSVRNFTKTQVLATNGILNEDAAYGIGYGVGTALGALFFGGNN